MNPNQDPNFHRKHFLSEEEHKKVNRYVEITAAYINLFTKTTDRVLDVGGSDGIMQDFIRCHSIRSIDIYPGSERVAKGTIYGEQNETYDVIIYNHVLEHIWRGYDEMEQAKAKLKKGGILFVATPYFTAPLAYEPEDHVALYNEHILRRLCNELGMEAVEYSTHNFREDKIEQWFVMKKK